MAKDTNSGKEKTNIRRIKATDDKKVKKPSGNKTVKTTKVVETAKTTKQKPEVKLAKDKTAKSTKLKENPFKKMVNYFKGAWYELRQVHWPSRSATWSMTGAVLLFSLFFVILIVLLDTGFNWIFEQLLR